MTDYEKHIKKSFPSDLTPRVLLIGLKLNLGGKVAMLKYEEKLSKKLVSELLQKMIYEMQFIESKYPEDYKEVLLNYPYMNLVNLKKVKLSYNFKEYFSTNNE